MSPFIDGFLAGSFLMAALMIITDLLDNKENADD